MKLADLLFGKPLATSEERGEQVGPVAGIPIFGLDALSSAAYGPEAALTLLIPLGLLGVHLIVPVTTAILILLVIVYFSYRQTIEAYPQGGGSYTVATENLGKGPGLLAAAALMIDYILTAAVGISAGVGALISAVPSLQKHTLLICLAILLILTIINLRGVHDTGVAFMVPTYLFLGTLLIVIGVGIFQTVTTGGHPYTGRRPAKAARPPQPLSSLWLILKVFASGCTAMTGVEAVSNGVKAFREPTTKNARLTLTIIIALLIVLLAGIALLCRWYGIGATDPEGPGYQSVLSQLTTAVMGHGVFYYVTIASILLVLSLSANTAFADFPRLTRAIALHDYLPHVFFVRGRRLLYSHGIAALVTLTALLLIFFGGVTDRLIPLYAIGAFLAFTLSQAGMVVHWLRNREPGWRLRMAVNGSGAFATGITTLVVLVAKFHDGAWVTALLVPLMILAHDHGEAALCARRAGHRQSPPIEHRGHQAAARHHPPRPLEPPFRKGPSIRPGHVAGDHRRSRRRSNDEASICDVWEKNVAEPLQRAGLAVPQLVVLKSPYRFVLAPVIDFILNRRRPTSTARSPCLCPNWS